MSVAAPGEKERQRDVRAIGVCGGGTTCPRAVRERVGNATLFAVWRASQEYRLHSTGGECWMGFFHLAMGISGSDAWRPSFTAWCTA